MPSSSSAHSTDNKTTSTHKRNNNFRPLHFFAILVVPLMAFFIAKQYYPGAINRLMAKRVNGVFERLRSIQGNYRTFSSNVALDNATLPTHFTLPTGDRIPSVALGVWKASPADVRGAVKAALTAGYRHIDGAEAYGNEAEVGEAIKSSGISREDIWLTSKLWNDHHAPEDVEAALDESLRKLGTDYLDLYLIHWPVAFGKDGKLDTKLTEDQYTTWKKLEELVEKGKIKNIGVANFNIRRLKELIAHPLKIKPAVNQVEINYWNPEPELLEWSKRNGILLQAYSPLGSSNKVKETLELPEIKSIAQELTITPAQVVISWILQRGIVVLPKSVTPARIEENLKVTALPLEAFQRLEKAAISHPPLKILDPSPHWGVDLWDTKRAKL